MGGAPLLFLVRSYSKLTSNMVTLSWKAVFFCVFVAFVSLKLGVATFRPDGPSRSGRQGAGD